MSLPRVGILGLALLLLIAALPPVSGAPALRVEAPLGNTLADVHATLALAQATWYNDADGDNVFDDLEARFLAAPL